MVLLELINVHKYYEKLLAVKGISFSVKTNQIIAILGSNGAGKSTTIKMLCGLLKPSEGSISIDNRSYDNDADFIRNEIGYVPEESAMYNDIGVFDYLHFFADLYKIPSKIAIERVNYYLDALDLKVGNRLIGQLSKGMKRKVLLVRSLLNDPKILIYDEPASGLDPQTAAFILKFIQDMKKKGKTIIFSSHNLGHVEQIAERVIIIHKGEKIFDSDIEKLIKSKKQQFQVKYVKGGIEVDKKMSLSELKLLMQDGENSIKEIVTEQRSVEEAFLSMVK